MADKQSAFDEFAKKPLKFQVLVFCGIAVFLGLIYYQFMYSGLLDERSNAKATNDRLVKQRDEKHKSIEEMKTLVQKIKDNEIKEKEAAKSLPTSEDNSALYDYLQRKAQEAGLENMVTKPAKTQSVEGYFRVPMEVEAKGSFYQIKQFFASIAPQKRNALDEGTEPALSGEMLITVSNVFVGDAKARGAEVLLTAKFVAATYYKAESKAPGGAAAAPGPRGSTPAAPAAGGGR